MLCEKCHERQATIHLTEIIKDVKSELHLCENCAREVGFNSKLSNFTISVPEMLSFLEISELEGDRNALNCNVCGMTYADFRRKNMLGCSNCYTFFKDTVESLVLNYHGEKKHIGKIPHRNSYTDEPSAKADIITETHLSLMDLQEELERAIMDERYEEAAMLRDRIRKVQ